MPILVLFFVCGIEMNMKEATAEGATILNSNVDIEKLATEIIS